MRKLYEKVNETLNIVSFDEIWKGFTKTNFALYNKKNVFLKDGIIPYDNRFLGNTTIKYEEENLAIWLIENIEEVDYKELVANIVHEMFHSFQISQNESRFPNDIKALSYPSDLENYQLKYNENIMLVNAINSKEKNKKIDILSQIVTSRKLRLNKFGNLIKYEFIIETIEGSAEYCGTKALKSISNNLYQNRLEKYKEILLSDKKMLFDIRRCCYYWGTLFLLLLDEIEIDFTKEIQGQSLTIFEQIIPLMKSNTIINQIKSEKIDKDFKEERLRKEKLIDDFNSKNPIIYDGEFSICGYDPMNMFKIDNKIFCSNFLLLYNIVTKENIFIPGPVIVKQESDSDIIKSYYTINE